MLSNNNNYDKTQKFSIGETFSGSKIYSIRYLYLQKIKIVYKFHRDTHIGYRNNNTKQLVKKYLEKEITYVIIGFKIYNLLPQLRNNLQTVIIND